MRPSYRSLIGLSLAVIWLLFYVVAAAHLGSNLAQASRLVQLIYFPLAGLLWVLPLYPLMRWVSRGQPKK